MTTSYELSLRLKELGVEQEGGEYYYYDVKGQEMLLHSLSFMAASFSPICRALTLGEVVRMLGLTVEMYSTTFGYYFCRYGVKQCKSESPEEAAGELLAETLKQKEG